nr:MAG TPA: hypothetical protein [Caudoviricetes sp.]
MTIHTRTPAGVPSSECLRAFLFPLKPRPFSSGKRREVFS